MLFLILLQDTPTTEIYTLSLHDALPISSSRAGPVKLPSACFKRCTSTRRRRCCTARATLMPRNLPSIGLRSEEHTSELQSRRDLVCRLLLEKKKRVDYIVVRDCSITQSA